MRVLWVGHNLAYPPVRGVLQRNFNLLREAAKQSEVHVLAFDQPGTRPPGVGVEDCVEALKRFCASAEHVPLGSGVLKSRYWLGARGLLSSEPYDINWLASSAMANRLRELLEAVPFDVVHFDTVGLAPYRRIVQREGTVLNHHNIESSMMAHRSATEKRSILRKFFGLEAFKLRRAERTYCPQFDMNLVVSPEDGDELRSLAPGIRTTVVANGVDTEYFTPRPDPGGSTLVFCGGLDWYPNGDAMAYFFDTIWPMLIARVPDVKMIVVGRRPPDWLKKFAEMDVRVRVTGFVNDVRPYFHEATAYVCPIRIGGGTRLKILDALAMGMPLIGTTFACSGISVGHEKEVLLADAPEDFVERIVRVLSDPQLRATLAAQGRERVCNEYSWNVVGQELMLAYSKASSAAIQRTAHIQIEDPK